MTSGRKGSLGLLLLRYLLPLAERGGGVLNTDIIPALAATSPALAVAWPL